MIALRGAIALLLIVTISACGRVIPPGQPPAPQQPTQRSIPPASSPIETGENAIAAGVVPGPPVQSLLPDEAAAIAAFRSFRQSCPSVVNRVDTSGLTQTSDWAQACSAAADSEERDARAFFAQNFVSVQVGDGQAFATGYYEPEIAASRDLRPDYLFPVYRAPTAIPSVCEENCAPGHSPLDRAAIEDGALQGQGLEIAYAQDIVDLYFLQVQGSGLLRLPEGPPVRVGYAANNGYPYVSIGRLMRDRGLLQSGELTAEGIANWLRENPEEGRAIMQENRRYIFFRELDSTAPLGSLGYPVTPRTTIAADPAYVPLGAPVILDMEHDIADGLWIAQDTGGAIRGANRFDTFWGAGDEAYAVASGMASRGQAWILLPRVSAERLARAD